MKKYRVQDREAGNRSDDFKHHPEFEIIDIMNALPKYPDAGTPFGDVFVQNNNGIWWIECPVTGFGYYYKTLIELMKRWRITLTGYNYQNNKFSVKINNQQQEVER